MPPPPPKMPPAAVDLLLVGAGAGTAGLVVLAAIAFMLCSAPRMLRPQRDGAGSRAPPALSVLIMDDATGVAGVPEGGGDQPTVANKLAAEDAHGCDEGPQEITKEGPDPEADLEPTAGDEVVTRMPIHIAAISMTQYL